ncbi:cell division protein FtsA [bacterium]|nr:cell division protein FtsA [bacterium]
MSETIAGLDIGTSKTVFIIVDESEAGELCLLGFGESKTEGVVNGVIVNPEKAEKTILKAYNDAQKIADVKVKSVICCLNGEHLKSISSRGVTAVPKSQEEITAADVVKVKKAAETIVLPQDTQIIDSIVQDFSVDGQEGILDPVGMIGVRMEANVTMITADVVKVQSLHRALQKAGLEVANLYPTAICSAEAVLTPEEREVGIAMLDIGAGTTNIAIYKKGKPVMISVIKYAGESISKDISIGLQLPIKQAEDLKLSNGFATQSKVEEGSVVNVPSLGGRETKMISSQFLAKIIEARIEEILIIAKEQLESFCPLKSIAGGIVITGGSSQLKGLVELAERIFNIPVRLGIPKIAGEIEEFANSPVYSSVIGSVIYHSRKKTEYELDLMYEEKKMGKFWTKIRKWLLRKL